MRVKMPGSYKKYHSYKGTVGKIAPIILNCNFQSEKTNKKLVTDITEFKLFGEKLYLSPMLDLFTDEIITYTIGSRPTCSLYCVTDLDKLPINSHQDWHYQMKQYRHSLKNCGITQSMSCKGNCYGNAIIEKFFGIMKLEFLYRKEFESITHFKQELAKYIDYYNHKRIKAASRVTSIRDLIIIYNVINYFSKSYLTKGFIVN
ncbi:IS3 family transposase [Bacillus cereus]|uniref:IS3 family transposase n=1 Tax=Bacillus cereus TaxID=1396 RepID=UPI0020D288F9|nr:DDE-type integrase/transposase/recombinase [Bacillus cereus]